MLYFALEVLLQRGYNVDAEHYKISASCLLQLAIDVVLLHADRLLPILPPPPPSPPPNMGPVSQSWK